MHGVRMFDYACKGEGVIQGGRDNSMKLKHYIKKNKWQKKQWNIAINEHHEAKNNGWWGGIREWEKR